MLAVISCTMTSVEHLWRQDLLQQAFDQSIRLLGIYPLTGGCIHRVEQLQATSGDFCLKWSDEATQEVFSCEARALQLLRSTHTVPIPEPLAWGSRDGKSYLLMTYVQAPDVGGIRHWEALGARLAQMHQTPAPHDLFGLPYDNYIGSLRQSNDLLADGFAFFVERRLEPQLQSVHGAGLIDARWCERFHQLYPKLPHILPDERAVLLHGDLWSGNIIPDINGHGVLIDPAVYYGWREADLAMTHMFGGFDQRFYDAYVEHYPVHPGFQTRAGIYNLYPALVHVNLFGRSYLPGIESVLRYHLG